MPDSSEGNLNPVESVSSFVNEPGGAQAETVDWSRVRFTGYSVIAADVTPALPGRTTTLRARVLTETGASMVAEGLSIPRVPTHSDAPM